MNYRLGGAVSVSWQGDPALGCAEAGVCGVRGALTLRPLQNGTLFLDRAGAGWTGAGAGSTFTDPRMRVVRTTNVENGRVVGQCTDTVGSILDIEISRGPGAGSRIFLEASREPMSSGRCPGPTAFDLVPLAPRLAFDFDRLRRRGESLRIDVRRPLRAGAFSGEVAYGIVLRFGRLRAVRSEPRAPEPSGGRPPLVTFVHRVERLDVETTSAFRGLPELGCEVLDACGVAGTSIYRFANAGMRVVTHADSRGGPRLRTRALVLRAFRAGRLQISGSGDPPATARAALATTSAHPDRAPCRDAAIVPPSEVGIDSLGRVARFSVSPASGGDLLRGRCGGPLRADADFDVAAPEARVSPRALLAPRLALTLRAPRARVSARGYADERTGSATLVLRRERVVVRP